MELLHSQEYLQAVLQFVVHAQALSDKEHQLLGRPTDTGPQQGLQCDTAADVSTPCQIPSMRSVVLPAAYCIGVKSCCTCRRHTTLLDRRHHMNSFSHRLYCALLKSRCSRLPGQLCSAARSNTSALLLLRQAHSVCLSVCASTPDSV